MSGAEVGSATVLSVLTATGRGAVAVVAVAGPSATAAVDQFFLAANKKALSEQLIGRIVYGHWGEPTGEDLVVCRRAEDEVEVHCHGGSQASTRIVADLQSAGCEQLDWQAWLARSVTCPFALQAQIHMAQAPTLRTAKILLDQFHGALGTAFAEIQSDVENGRREQATQRIDELLEHAKLGLHLTRPWQVVVAGQPNVGKSSLINALVGFERAIVFDQPGTTRDVVTASTAVDGWPITLSDTAGLHESTDEIESAGIALAKQQFHTADLVLWVLDATAAAGGDLWQLAAAQAAEVELELNKARTLLIVNKIDQVEDHARFDGPALLTSALQDAGIAELLNAISQRLVPNPPAAGAAVPFTEEQVAELEGLLGG